MAGPDLVGRRFAADGLNRRWYGDGTEIATGEGKLHLASVLDMGSRRIVGFALSEHHDAELAYAALAMAVAIRGGREVIAGVVLHTDQGSESLPNRSTCGSRRQRRREVASARENRQMQRVVALGRGEAGKTVLSRQIGALIVAPVIELDLLFWRQPELKPLPPAEGRRLQSCIRRPASVGGRRSARHRVPGPGLRAGW